MSVCIVNRDVRRRQLEGGETGEEGRTMTNVMRSGNRTGVHDLTLNVVCDAMKPSSHQSTDEEALQFERRAEYVLQRISETVPQNAHCCDAWRLIVDKVLRPEYPFAVHKLLYRMNYKHHQESVVGPAPAWFPSTVQELVSRHGAKVKTRRVSNVERLFHNVLSRMNINDIASNSRLRCFLQKMNEDRRLLLQSKEWDDIREVQHAEEKFKLLYEISIEHPKQFWLTLLHEMRLTMINTGQMNEIVKVSAGYEEWFPASDSREVSSTESQIMTNIAYSCFNGRNMNAPAILFRSETSSEVHSWSLQELYCHAITVAKALGKGGLDLRCGDGVAICMAMTPASVALYLGIILAGLKVISIADSFSEREIAVRLRVGAARVVFTQDIILRGTKLHKLAQRVIKAASSMYNNSKAKDTDQQKFLCRCVILPNGDFNSVPASNVDLRQGLDVVWGDIVSNDNSTICEKETMHENSSRFVPCFSTPSATTNILFSSGTTGEPKAIPWSHLTPLRCGADARLLMDVSPGDVLMWPTNLGWMMGPWLIYAALLNDAGIGLHIGNPGGVEFIRTVKLLGTTILGTVPSLVRSWRNLEDNSSSLTPLRDTKIKCFASTGEASNPDDSLWLMSRLQGYRPIVEYCGGTELGGAYISGSLLQPQSPSTFSTMAFGTRIAIISESGRVFDVFSKERRTIGTYQQSEPFSGEIALVTPSLGTSTQLLNRNHFDSYFKGMPTINIHRYNDINYISKIDKTVTLPLRRHGDMMQKLPGGYYRAIGRSDDTMNLGGIKVGNAELERICVSALPNDVVEVAAVAVPPLQGGPAQLWLVVVTKADSALATVKRKTLKELDFLKSTLQKAISSSLNPLFKIHRILVVEKLPRTASNKVMRRVLRQLCEDEQRRTAMVPKL